MEGLCDPASAPQARASTRTPSIPFLRHKVGEGNHNCREAVNVPIPATIKCNSFVATSASASWPKKVEPLAEPHPYASKEAYLISRISVG